MAICRASCGPIISPSTGRDSCSSASGQMQSYATSSTRNSRARRPRASYRRHAARLHDRPVSRARARPAVVGTVDAPSARQPSRCAPCRPMLGDEDIVASDAQIRANRLNAQHSTGPQTENGKRAVRYNALKHGLLAEASLLPGEDTALFRRLAEELHAQFEPSGELEQLLVDRITSCAWRLRRVLQAEAGLFVARLKYAITL